MQLSSMERIKLGFFCFDAFTAQEKKICGVCGQSRKDKNIAPLWSQADWLEHCFYVKVKWKSELLPKQRNTGVLIYFFIQLKSIHLLCITCSKILKWSVHRITLFCSCFQVLKQLPAKEEKIEFCSMSEKQQALYEALFKKLKSTTIGESKII